MPVPKPCTQVYTIQYIPYLEVVWVVYSSWHTNQLGEYSLTLSQTRSHQLGWTRNLHIVTELCSVWSQSLSPPRMRRQCRQWHPYCSSQLQPSCQHEHLSNTGLDWPVEKTSTIMNLIGCVQLTRVWSPLVINSHINFTNRIIELHLPMCYMNYEQSWPQFIFNVMIFGQIDTLTAALHAKKMSDELPINSLNLSGICFFLILEKEKIILTCSNWWFAAAFAPVFFRYSDQSKLRFCQFSPTSLGRKEKEEKEKENHIKPETNITSIMRQKVLTTSYTQPTTCTSKSFIWQIGKKTACTMKCI